ncbi:MAG: FAD-dependent oxidoreductase [Candidatus Cloacimonetes bacterium]|nr:FAD-dependent oxidoreductase [Candidatus Cloacimonadota bacterium]
MKIGIIGAGFAGVTAAQVAAEAGAEVTLYSAEKMLPYFRPRLPEIAFEKRSNIAIKPLEWYSEKSINLKLNSEVISFNPDFSVVVSDNSKENFDALIIATGGKSAIPPFARNSNVKKMFTIWNLSDAIAISEQAKRGSRVVIIGGGVIGLETALRATNMGLDITVIDRNSRLMSRNFGTKASQVIEALMRKQNVKLLFDTSVSKVENCTDMTVKISLKNNENLLCDFVILSIGAGFDISLATKAGLNTDKRIIVDNELRTSSDGIFAAGDIAQFPIPCSAKEALAQGRIAGHNAVAWLTGEETRTYNPEPVIMRLKHNDFELYSVGKIPANSNEERILEFDAAQLYRGCVYEDNTLSGVQMVGSDKDFMKLWKEMINSNNA